MLARRVREIAKKFALKNALDYGKAEAGAVLNKVLAAEPRMRSEIRDLSVLVGEVVQEVNKMGRGDLVKAFGEYQKEFEKKDREKDERSAKPRMELEGAVVGKFSTRFPPEPNGYLQIGHAKIAWLEREFADIYKGTVALYFDDTNPEKEKQEYVDAIKKDLEWLGLGFEREYYASDHIEKSYAYADKLVGDRNAYVCTCDIEKIKKMRFESKECEHRKQSKSENAGLLKKMLDGGFKDGEAVLRLRLDVKAENTTMRDPVILRIIRHEHYRQGKKYVVWPTYDFNTPIVDSLEGITDAIRSKEYELRDELDMKILDLIGLRKPRIRSIARLEIKDNITSKRKTNELIEKGRLWGYDDPRLVTIAGLRRRGVQPQAIKEFVLRFGMSKTNSWVGIDMLLAENRKVIDDIAKRLFMVREPVELRIEGVPRDYKKVSLRLHPSKDLGTRDCVVSDRLLISGSDAKTLKEGTTFRLKDLFNVEVKKMGGKGIGARFIGNESIDAPKFQWVDGVRNVKCKLISIGPLLVNDKFNEKSMSTSDGYAEDYVNNLQKEEIVQFERVGFFKLDDVKEKAFIAL